VDPYLSIQQAADHLGISRQGLVYHLKRGRIGIPSTYGGLTLINSFELEKFARRRSVGTFAPIGRPRGAKDLRPRKRRLRELSSQKESRFGYEPNRLNKTTMDHINRNNNYVPGGAESTIGTTLALRGGSAR
jgi:excisionase family DNA binding protein